MRYGVGYLYSLAFREEPFSETRVQPREFLCARTGPKPISGPVGHITLPQDVVDPNKGAGLALVAVGVEGVLATR